MTKIEWTDQTWNPVTGCSHASPGCDNCYAERMAVRLRGRHGYPADDPFRVTMHPERLGVPVLWRKPRRVFVCSMSDLFHPDVPEGFIHSVWSIMALAPQHAFQVLTKRPQRMHRLLSRWVDEGHFEVLPNVWVGTSIEHDDYCWRVEHLQCTPAAVRFLSLEPLLGFLPSLDLTGIDWVIIGGESGPGARLMRPAWVYSAIQKCENAGVPVFVKQLGTKLAAELGVSGKGNVLEEMPQFMRLRQWPKAVSPEPV